MSARAGSQPMRDDPAPLTAEEAVRRLRVDPDRRALVEACYFDDPVLAAADRYHRSPEWREVQRILGSPPKGARALDIGAGRGIASYALARDSWQVTAVEPDPSPLVGAGAIGELAREAGLPIAIETHWGEALPFADESFDLVFCRQVLHHARDLPAFCKGAARVLVRGGLFVAAREHVLSKPDDLTAFLERHPLHALHETEHAFTLREYLAALRQAGLRVERRLNPLSSNINTAPQLRSELLAGQPRWWRALPKPIGLALLTLAGERLQTPGRLYSFICRKPV